ncbi:MAG: hypothetical protein ACRC8A_07505 [Microcoleaceae cyanobacterium]
MKTLSAFALVGALLFVPMGAAQASDNEINAQVQPSQSEYALSARTSNNSFYRLASRRRRFAEAPQFDSQDLFPHRGSGRVADRLVDGSLL